MSDRYPWAAEVLALLDAPPESVTASGGSWYVQHSGLLAHVLLLGDGRANVHVDTGGLWLVAHGVTNVPATVRALLAGLRAAQAALGGVMP
jgi:hypothetical protein